MLHSSSSSSLRFSWGRTQPASRFNFYEDEGLDPLPASTCIEARICRPELLVEIEAIAMIPKNRKR